MIDEAVKGESMQANRETSRQVSEEGRPVISKKPCKDRMSLQGFLILISSWIKLITKSTCISARNQYTVYIGQGIITASVECPYPLWLSIVFIQIGGSYEQKSIWVVRQNRFKLNHYHRSIIVDLRQPSIRPRLGHNPLCNIWWSC